MSTRCGSTWRKPRARSSASGCIRSCSSATRFRRRRTRPPIAGLQVGADLYTVGQAAQQVQELRPASRPELGVEACLQGGDDAAGTAQHALAVLRNVERVVAAVVRNGTALRQAAALEPIEQS